MRRLLREQEWREQPLRQELRAERVKRRRQLAVLPLIQRDGRPDLFVANYVRWSAETDIFTTLDGTRKAFTTPEGYPGDTCRLYRNRGGPRVATIGSSPRPVTGVQTPVRACPSPHPRQ
jgi:hypothetical protein